jgi:hypothetical protein
LYDFNQYDKGIQSFTIVDCILNPKAMENPEEIFWNFFIKFAEMALVVQLLVVVMVEHVVQTELL